MKTIAGLCLVGAAVLTMSGTANAAVINFTAVSYTDAASLTAGQKLITDFDTGSSPTTLGIAAGYGFTWCSYGCTTTYNGLNTGQTGLYNNVDLASGIAARPPGSVDSGTGTPGQYFAIAGATDGGQATLTAPAAMSSLEFLWGSVDPYNTISFYSGNSLIQSFSGSDITAPNAANGDQTSPRTNLEVSFRIPGADDVNKVVFTASGNSFEFDNIVDAAVPEPRIWIMLVLGFGLLGLMLRRRRSLVPTFAV